MRRKFQIEITEAAKQDVATTHDHIARDKPKAAAKWVRGFDRQVRSLRYLPLRYEVIPEATDLHHPYRHIIWGNYRVVYRVQDERVIVVRVIHSARLLNSRHLEL